MRKGRCAMDDHALMARLAAGDDEALGELIRRHHASAMQQAVRFLQDEGLAEDVVQEAFARVYLMRTRYRSDFAFTTYLAALVRNLCIDQWRKARRSIPVPEVDAGLCESAEAVWLAGESRRGLWSALSGLPPQDCALLTGYALEGLSYQQLARREGLSAGQVRIRLHRIRQKLRKERDRE